MKVVMAEQPLASAALVPALVPAREAAALLQAAARRLSALGPGVDQRLHALVGALQALPAAASFDPFAAVPPAADAAPTDSAPAAASARGRAAGPAGDAAGAPRGHARPAVTAAVVESTLQALRATQATLSRVASGSTDTGAGRAPSHAPGAAAALRRDTAVGAGSVDSTGRSAVSLGPLAAAQAVRTLAAWPADALALWMPAGAPDAGRAAGHGTPPAGLTLPAAAEAAGAVALSGIEQVGALLGRLDDARRGGALAASPAQPPTRHGTARRSATAGMADAAPRVASPGATAATAPPAAPAARRAASLLLGDAAAAGMARGLATSLSDVRPALGGTPAARPDGPGQPSDTPGADELIAEINRQLVDQAWQRGVDLQ
jgi:hypothetical protein